MINKPTHFINQSSSSIDLIFSSNTSFAKDCGSEPSIYEKCHHKIIYRTLNFNIPLQKRSKLTKRYYVNPTDYNKEMLLHQISEYTRRNIWLS